MPTHHNTVHGHNIYYMFFSGLADGAVVSAVSSQQQGSWLGSLTARAEFASSYRRQLPLAVQSHAG